jgi:hypothetical protein
MRGYTNSGDSLLVLRRQITLDLRTTVLQETTTSLLAAIVISFEESDPDGVTKQDVFALARHKAGEGMNTILRDLAAACLAIQIVAFLKEQAALAKRLEAEVVLNDLLEPEPIDDLSTSEMRRSRWTRVRTRRLSERLVRRSVLRSRRNAART